MVKKKVIYWKKLVDKVASPFLKKMNAIFNAHAKETKGLSAYQSNLIWNKKYKAKYNKIDNQLDDALNKLYYKYHYRNNKIKEGYILK